MSDYYRVSAPAITRRGLTKTYAIVVRESDSEVIPTLEKQLMLEHALRSKRLKLAGPVTVEAIDKPQEAAA